MDGGLTNPVPISAARALGADVVIAVNPNSKPPGRVWVPERGEDIWDGIAERMGGMLPEMFRGAEPTVEQDIPGPHGAEVLNASIDILTEYLRRTRLAVDPADVMIDVDLSDMSAMSFYDAERAIAAGREAARACVDDIRAVLERKG